MSLGDWRDVSIILLALEALIIGLIYGAIFYYLRKGFRITTIWLSQIGLPGGRRYARTAKDITQQYSKKIVRPIVSAETTLTRTTRTVGHIAKIPKLRTRS
jgi:hypothetical protein